MSDSKPLRVCLWAPLPPPDGGISRWTARYCAEAARFGLNVVVVDTMPRRASFSERSRFSLKDARWAFQALGELWRVLRKQRPDAVHVTTSLFWGTPRDFLALCLCRLHGVPTVLNIRGSSQIVSWRESLGRVRRRMLDVALRSARVTAVLSSELKAYLERSVRGLRVILIPNMISATEIAAGNGSSARILPALRTRHRVLYVGFRTPLKGIADLAEALLALEDCELILAGEAGEAKEAGMQRRMEQSLSALRVTGRLVETGRLMPEQVTSLYREVELFVLPSYREGLPNVLLEAMAAGLPCIATPVGAIPDVLMPDCGVIVPVGDPTSLRTAIRRLIDDSVLREALGKRARQRIHEHYSVDVVMSAYRALYQELAVNSRCNRDGRENSSAPR